MALESGVVTAGGGIVMGGEGMMMTDGSMDDKDMRVEAFPSLRPADGWSQCPAEVACTHPP